MKEWRASPERRLLGVTVMLVALLPAAASAHATLVGSMPGDGVVVTEAPAAFRLAFNEPIAVTGLKLTGGGRTITLDRFRTDAKAVEIDAPTRLASGAYALSYRVVSEDGHPVAGAVSFAIGGPEAGLSPKLDLADRTLAASIWATRLAIYVGLLFGAGGAFALAWLTNGSPGGRGAVVACAALGLSAAPIALVLQGADLVGVSFEGAFDPVVWRQALGTSYAWTLATAMMTLAVATLSMACRGGAAKALSAVALCGVGLALAASGHASAAAPQALMRAAVSIHGVAAAFWMGALLPLFVAWRSDPASSARSLRRFSAAALYAVGALALAGTVLAVRQVETVAALWNTDYGLILLSKLALVAVLFVLAAANRWRCTRRALKGEVGARRSLSRSIGAELVIGALVLGVVALWRFTPPPRSLSVQSAEPATVHLQTSAMQTDVTIKPGRVGLAEVTVIVMTTDNKPLSAKQLTLVLSNPAAGVEAIRREAANLGDGRWRAAGILLPAAGVWTVGAEMLVTDFDLKRIQGRIEVRP